MADPNYGAAPRQTSSVIRTDDEFEMFRRKAAQKASEERRAAMDRRDASREQLKGTPYYDLVHQYDEAPSIASIMLATGADAQTAGTIRRTGNWNNYTPTGGWDQYDDGAAVHAQLVGKTPTDPADFQWKDVEPTLPGTIMPSYADWGNGDFAHTNWVLQGHDRRPFVLGSGSTKEEVYRAAMDYGVGTQGLNAFAGEFGAPNWDALDWNKVTDGGGYNNKENWRWNPDEWTGDYRLGGRGLNGSPALIHREDGTTIDPRFLPNSTYQSQQDWNTINDQFSLERRLAGAPIKAMNADYAATMPLRDEVQTRAEQGYGSMLGNGATGGLIPDNYSDAFFGQITGREAPANPFQTQQGKYPWSLPTQQLDLASLMPAGYGGPSGGASMGQYGNRSGGLGGLGGMPQGQNASSNASSAWGGPFSNRNPWSLG